MFADEDGTPAVPPEYVEVLEHELNTFQTRFRAWITVFPTGGESDDWGLFY